MGNRRRNSNLRRKSCRLRSEARGTARAALSFIPGLGLALSTHDTTRKAVRTARVAKDYGNELYKEAKRQINRRNPFYCRRYHHNYHNDRT